MYDFVTKGVPILCVNSKVVKQQVIFKNIYNILLLELYL
jgi:hypothetical protein